MEDNQRDGYVLSMMIGEYLQEEDGLKDRRDTYVRGANGIEKVVVRGRLSREKKNEKGRAIRASRALGPTTIRYSWLRKRRVSGTASVWASRLAFARGGLEASEFVSPILC